MQPSVSWALLAILLGIIFINYTPAAQDLITTTFFFLASAPINFWFYLIFLPAFLTFFIPPGKARRRGILLLLVIGMTYVFINLSLHNANTLGHKAYEQCRKEKNLLMSQSEAHAECDMATLIPTSASPIFYLILGWIPATVYAAMWEIAWRRKHKHIMISLWKGMGDDLIGNILVRVGIYCTLLLVVVFAIVLAEAFYHLLFL
jgi:hypothetical protein